MISKTLIGATVGFLMVAAPFATPLAFAATTTTTTTSAAPTIAATTGAPTQTLAALEAQIALLIKQVATLTSQLAHVRTEQKVTTRATLAIVSQLRIGSHGKSVKVLQRLLASNPAIYPQGLITGYYGRLTEAAVKKFQSDNGIESVGDVGPQTRSVLNAYLKHATSTISSRFLQEFEAEGSATSTSARRAHRERFVRMCQRAGTSGNTHTIVVAGPAVLAHVREGDALGECNRERGDRTSREHGNRSEDHGSQSEQSSVGGEQSSTTTESTSSSSDHQTATTTTSSDSSSASSEGN